MFHRGTTNKWIGLDLGDVQVVQMKKIPNMYDGTLEGTREEGVVAKVAQVSDWSDSWSITCRKPHPRLSHTLCVCRFLQCSSPLL